MPTWPHTAVTGGKGSLTSCCMEIRMERKWLTPQSVMKAHAIYNTWIFIKRVLKWAISTELLISVLQPSPLSTQIPCSWSRPRGGLLLLISEPTLPDFPSSTIKVPCKRSLPGDLLPSLLSVHLFLMEEASPASWPPLLFCVLWR